MKTTQLIKRFQEILSQDKFDNYETLSIPTN